MPQLTKLFPGFHNKLKILNRLDKYVSGGIVVGREAEFGRMVQQSYLDETQKNMITKRYLGIIGIPDTIVDIEKWIKSLENESFKLDKNFRGTITKDLEILNRDYDESSPTTRFIKKVDATTNIKILLQLKKRASSTLASKYPQLYKDKTLVPMILETVTGRKNQLRDHVLQTFGISLLNDDNFAQFKLYSAGPKHHGEKIKTLINSTIFKSNQIGLHAGYVKVSTNKGLIMPLSEADQELWSPFLDRNGDFGSLLTRDLKNRIK
ncbi:pseudouridylate synthase pus5 [Scheffersomyces spartinae]|uniref:Pseudouridylate synthase pus5 n=1 Tax=Scheffersomyces spartinae TaxID=45513 RepID=A0A9P7V5P1_9ASCO|nr:pseudouridylate synthase pus5 [Scheffersomyces spartinae]KAG7191683.1 pseudouridylate synthase pus5 [Scheffersomyces spartinae]